MNDFWQTPDNIIKAVKSVLGDDYFDPCPISPTFNGLTTDWKPNCYINPPYSRGSIESWSAKGYVELKRLIKENHEPNFIWLINYGATHNRVVIKRVSSALCDLYSRVNFIDPVTGKPGKGNDRDSVIYFWGFKVEEFYLAFENLGEIFVKNR